MGPGIPLATDAMLMESSTGSEDTLDRPDGIAAAAAVVAEEPVSPAMGSRGTRTALMTNGETANNCCEAVKNDCYTRRMFCFFLFQKKVTMRSGIQTARWRVRMAPWLPLRGQCPCPLN